VIQYVTTDFVQAQLILNDLIGALPPPPPPASDYTSYLSILSQAGAADPTAVDIFNNTGITIAYTRAALGHYIGTASAALLLAAKTYFPPFGNFTDNAIMLPIYGASPLTYAYQIIRVGDSSFDIHVFDSVTFAAVELSAAAIGIGIPIELRIYT